MGGLLKLRKFDIVRTDSRYVKKTAASIFTLKTNEITRKYLILYSSISDKWQKTLKTPKKVAGPVGKEGVLGWVNRLGVEMQEKAQKDNLACHKMSYFQLGLR